MLFNARFGCTCVQIYEAGLYGPRYQHLYWSGIHGVLDGPGTDDDCTPQQVDQAREGVLYFVAYNQLVHEAERVGLSGYVSIVA